MSARELAQPIRVAFLTVMPSPYIQDLFAGMAADGRIAPRVYYLEMEAPDTYWGDCALPEYAEVVPGRWFSFLGSRLHVNRGAVRRILAGKPEVVVVAGYAGLTNQAVMAALHARGIPWIFWGEIPAMNRRGAWGRLLRWLAQRPAVRWPQGIAAVGQRAAEVYRAEATSDCLVRNIPYCCNVEPFLAIPRETTAREDAPVRFLFCGQLIARKGVDLLLRAFLTVADRHERVQLTLVGEGPLHATLQAAIPQRHRDKVVLAGFQSVTQLPRWFAEADVFVLPSRHDGWGVVVQQAVAAGLPVVVSDAVGAAPDLVREGYNGHVVPAGQSEPLARVLESLALWSEKRLVFGAHSRTLASQWQIPQAVDDWYQFCGEVLRRARSSPEPEAVAREKAVELATGDSPHG